MEESEDRVGLGTTGEQVGLANNRKSKRVTCERRHGQRRWEQVCQAERVYAKAQMHGATGKAGKRESMRVMRRH